MYYVYLLKSKIYNQIYTGSTNDLKRRLLEHNLGKEFSTKRYMPWQLVYYEAYLTEALARIREKQLKSHGNALRELKKRTGLDNEKSGGIHPAPAFQKKSGAGFTLTELIVVIALVVLLGGLALPALRIAQKNLEVEDSAESLVSVLRLAQNRTLGSEGASQYGVFFDTAASPDQFILFRGATYATRDVAADESYILPQSVEISAVTIPQNEVVFARVTGTAVNTGSVTVRLLADPTKQASVYVSSSGTIQKTSAPIASDENRQKDSRHVHVDYIGRTIATGTESVRLVFSSMTYEIVIASNMQNSQIFWEGGILVDGETQTLQVQTHLLNDPILGTQFSVTRDKSKNTKALTIEISGDSTGDIVRYDTQGQTTQGNSLYVSSPFWQ